MTVIKKQAWKIFSSTIVIALLSVYMSLLIYSIIREYSTEVLYDIFAVIGLILCMLRILHYEVEDRNMGYLLLLNRVVEEMIDLIDNSNGDPFVFDNIVETDYSTFILNLNKEMSITISTRCIFDASNGGITLRRASIMLFGYNEVEKEYFRSYYDMMLYDHLLGRTKNPASMNKQDVREIAKTLIKSIIEYIDDNLYYET